MYKVEVCCQPLKRFKGLVKVWKHCYIKILTDGGSTWHTYGILGDQASTKNQIPRRDDPRNSSNDCKNVSGTDCQIRKLMDGLEASYWSGTCPSCGDDNYKAWVATDLVDFFDGYNSNTYVYNMILGAGMTPPGEPRAPLDLIRIGGQVD